MTRASCAIYLWALLLLSGCGTTALPGPLASNVVVAEGVRMEMKWCSLSQARQVVCELEMTSLLRDRRAGLAYPKLQDQRGREYRMKSELMKLMVADQPYTITLTASNLSRDGTGVRSIVGTMAAKTPDGVHSMANEIVTFSGIPARPAASSPAPPATPAPAPERSARPAPAPASAPAPAEDGSVSGSHWFARIVPVAGSPDNEVVRLWARGAYLHLREDGILGYNWSVPSSYDYLGVNQWSEQGRSFTLTMSGARYSFERKGAADELEAFLDPGGAFRMTLQPRAAGER